MKHNITKYTAPARRLLVLSLLLGAYAAFGLVDTKNGNYTKTYKDIDAQGFTLERMYSSRSLYRGLFGYGWCSNLETRIEVLPDNSLKAVECGGGLEVPYTSQKTAAPNDNKMIQMIMARVKKKKGLSQRYIQKVENDLKNSPQLRSELLRVFGITGSIKAGQVYYNKNGSSIQFTGREYKRRHADGKVQVFNQEGYLTAEKYKNGTWIKIKRKNSNIQKVLTSGGKSFQFKRGKKKNLLTITGPGVQLVYTIQKDNLTAVVRGGKRHEHFYDNYHNMIKTRYPDNTYESLTYNVVKDWVVGFKDRSSCHEDYTYQVNPRNKNHYWTTVKKLCGRRVTNNSRYEFWNKKSSHGHSYLYRAKQNINGQIADIVYDAKTGGPLSVTRNKVTVRYAYDPKTGFLRSRRQPGRLVAFSAYNQCRKPQKVQVSYLKGKKVVRRVQTQLFYSAKDCYLTQARQPATGRWVVVKRDHLGRIHEMYDQSKKKIVVQYNEALGKPKLITRPGVGSIVVAYNQKGQVDSSKSKTNPIVAAQVAGVFNGFLEIISPVVSDIAI